MNICPYSFCFSISEGSHVHETPRRVFGMVPSSGMRFCDYMFPDEVVADSVERFQTLLDLVLTEQDIQVDVESLPGMNMMSINHVLNSYLFHFLPHFQCITLQSVSKTIYIEVSEIF